MKAGMMDHIMRRPSRPEAKIPGFTAPDDEMRPDGASGSGYWNVLFVPEWTSLPVYALGSVLLFVASLSLKEAGS